METIIHCKNEQNFQNQEEYFVASIDPGITDGCLVVVDVISGRIAHCKFFSLVEVVDKLDGVYQHKTLSKQSISRLIKDGNAESIRQMEKARAKKKKPAMPISKHRVAEAVNYLVNVKYREALSNANCVLIETQMKPHLSTVQACFQSHFIGRCVLSCPKTVRTYFDISVKGISAKCKSLGKTAARSEQRKSYEMRKKLSNVAASRFIEKEQLHYIRSMTTRYWKSRKRRRHRMVNQPSKLKARKEKSYNDACESYLQAMCPANWKLVQKRCHSFATACIIDKQQPSSKCLQKQMLSRCAWCTYSSREPVPLPEPLESIIRKYDELMRQRTNRRNKERRASATSSGTNAKTSLDDKSKSKSKSRYASKSKKAKTKRGNKKSPYHLYRCYK
jgi:hypothetical protein